MKPPCSKWHLWIGKECEGKAGINMLTVFIREISEELANDPKRLTNQGKFRRVWFCKEFKNWKQLRAIAEQFDEVCVEVTPKNWDNVPRDILAKYRIYLKVNYPLKDGDHVSVGLPFHEETFLVGEGKRNKPEDYMSDIKVLPKDEV